MRSHDGKTYENAHAIPVPISVSATRSNSAKVVLSPLLSMCACSRLSVVAATAVTR